MNIQPFAFNPLGVNCFVLWDETQECVIIDPSCYYDKEMEILSAFIKEKSLTPKMSIATHFHFDHVMGAAMVCRQFNIPLAGHKNYGFMWEIGMFEQSMTFGFTMDEPPVPTILLEQGSTVSFGNETLETLHCPGHSPCGIALYQKENAALFCGDILFHMSIGRTDLPGGDHEQLLQSIRNRIFTLPGNVTVFTGHGEPTTVEREKNHNPFF